MRKTIVIGDVHGYLQPLQALLDKIGPSADDEIISLGDIVDRGPNSPECLDFFRKHKAIMGNHEYKHVRFRNGILPALSRSQVGAREQFWQRGDYDAAVDYMESLPFYIDRPDAVMVHAGMQYGIPMDKQDPRVLVGGMSQKHICGIDPRTQLPYWCARYPKTAKPILFGHLTVKVPTQENLFSLDTGCCHGGTLTALTLPDFRLYQVPASLK